MKNAKWWTGLLATVMLAGVASGTEITLEQAETAVGNWIARGGAFGKRASQTEVSGETFVDADTGAKMHVVHVPGKGFAVTSADDGIEPIVLFSDGNDDFAAEEGNPLWDLLRWDLAGRRKALEEEAKLAAHRKDGGASEPGAAARAKWAELLSDRTARGTVSSGFLWKWMNPLLKTRWNQMEGSGGAVYNMFTPVKTEVTTVSVAKASARAPAGWTADSLVTNELGHYPVGCVAVAGGQVMKYWEHPKSAKAKTVACYVDDVRTNLTFWGSQYADAFGESQRLGSYKWSDMGAIEPRWGHSSEYVSRLLSDIGVACGADYRMSGTSMALATLASEMKSTFGYANVVYHTGSLSGEALREAMVPNLDAGAPVMMGIGGAHAVVADAYGYMPNYTTNAGALFLHVNFGWGGASDAWYLPPGIGKYSPIEELVCNVFPRQTGVVLSGRVTGQHGWAVYNMDVSCGGNSVRTDHGGLYHFILPPGTYQVSATNAWRSSVTAGPQTVTLPAMTRTVNGNRILDFRVPNAPTVQPIVRTRPGTVARETGTTFSEAFELTLSCATEGAEIHYTLDGSEPGGDDPVYEGPIPIQDTVTLRAVAMAPGMERSEMLEETYTFNDPTSRDNFADARPISGAWGKSSFNNAGYTKESGEPTHSSKGTVGGASAWAKWTAPMSGDWTFRLSGRFRDYSDDMNTQLAVYTGNSVVNLTRVAANDDVDPNEEDYSSRVSFSAQEGQTYYIAMDSYRGDLNPGTLKLEWEEGYVHYVQASYTPQWVPASGGRQEMGIDSSTNWYVVDCSDWITPANATGRSGDSLAYIVASNAAGKERTGYVTLQSGNSPRISFTLRQHVLDFATTKEAALDRAWRENKRILVIYGREGCGITSSTMFHTLPTASVRALLDAGYVLWYSNCDRQSDAWPFVRGFGGPMLPTLAIVDPLDPSAGVAGLDGPQDASAIQALLQTNPSWPGLPQARIEIESFGNAAATVSTKVRSWGTGASSASVTLETGSDADFSRVTGTRTLGTVTTLWSGQEWTCPTPVPDARAFCRVRVSSGDWSVVSDVFEFVPVEWGYRMENGKAIVTNALYAKGIVEIPATLGGCPVGGIGDGAFSGATNVLEVVIPAGVTDIGAFAFGGCTGLTSVELPYGVKNLGEFAFWRSSLTSLDLPNSVTNIGESAFYYATDLASLVIPDSVKSLGRGAFVCCYDLMRLEVPGAWWGTDYVTRSGVSLDCEVVYRGIHPLAVVTAKLPDGMKGMGYQTTMEATGGIAPYTWRWSSAGQYAESAAAGSHAATGTAQGWKADDSCWDLPLPFAFPFFGNSYTNAKVNSNGAISFGTANFISYSGSTILASPIIAVLWTDLKTTDGDIYVSSGSDAVTVRWQGAYLGSGEVNVSATLRKDGTIELKYGAGNANGGTIGISAGDGTRAFMSAKNGTADMGNAQDIVFRPAGKLPPGLSLASGGMIQGTPTAVGEYAFMVAATDTKGVTATRNLTLKVLEPKQVTTYKGNGGTPATQERTNTVGKAYGTMPVVTFAGHAFLGWFTEASGGSEVTTTDKVTATATRKLYAHWTTKQVTTFKGNGGTPATLETTNTIGAAYGDMPLVAWSNHGFLGWYTATNGGTRVLGSYNVTEEATRTLWARWTDKQTTVFLGNGGTPEEQVRTNTMGKAYGTLPAVTWTNHAFLGWFTEASGGSEVTKADKTTTAATRTLYAHWTTNQVVTFMGNEGTPSVQKTTNLIGAAYGTLPTANRSGYALAGWFTAASGGTKVTAASAVTTAAARTLYAHWTTNQVTTFAGNGGKPATQKTTNAIGKAYGTMPLVTWANHAFLGWYDTAAGGKLVSTNSTVTVAATRTLWAHWTDQQVTTFMGNGGTPKTLKTTNTIGQAYGDMPKVTWSNHVFLGWYTATNGGTRIFGKTKVTAEATRTLWALWTDKQTTVFLGNGGKPEEQLRTNTMSKAYGALPQATWANHAFLGWYTAEEGGKLVSTNSTVTVASTRTLWAHWTTNQVTTYKGNGGTPKTQKTTNTVGQTYGINMPKATWSNHVFLGWYTATNGGTRIFGKTKVTAEAARTLWAHWTLADQKGVTAAPAISGFAVCHGTAAVPGSVQNASGSCTVEVEAMAGCVYEIQWTPGLCDDWSALGRWLSDEDGTGEIELPIPGDAPAGFYRLAIPDMDVEDE